MKKAPAHGRGFALARRAQCSRAMHRYLRRTVTDLLLLAVAPALSVTVNVTV